MTDVARLEIHRPDSPWRDRFRRYTVQVDGQALGKVSRGATEHFSVLPGQHTVRATIDWASSNTLEVAATVGQPVRLIVQPVGGTGSLGTGGYLSLRRVGDDPGGKDASGACGSGWVWQRLGLMPFIMFVAATLLTKFAFGGRGWTAALTQGVTYFVTWSVLLGGLRLWALRRRRKR